MIRFARNPVLTRADVPDVPGVLRDVSSVFNPGAARVGNDVVLLVRVQTRGRRTHILRAVSAEGESFAIEPDVLPLDVPGAYHVYDPRVTPLEGRFAVTVAADTDDGCRLAVFVSDDLRSFESLGVTDDADTRNAVVFPERVGGRYARLDRPNRPAPPGEPPTGDAVHFATSDDLLSWTDHGPVVRGRPRYWDERLGSGPPPIATDAGWLHIYHGVATHFASANIYQAGAVLLDRDDPTRVIGRTRDNILEPREPYELVGQVPNVVFPSGWIRDGDRLTVYYGAADTVIAAATTTVDDIVAACMEAQ